MTKNTKIEWAHHTFNPWIGCTKVGPGCDNCYAEADFSTRRKVVQWGAGQPRKHTAPSTWAQPLRWNKEAERLGVRYRVFCASLADVFDNEVPVQWRIELMSLILQTPNLDWLLLTKRIGNAAGMLETACRAVHAGREGWADNVPANVWIGATICNQAEAERDIPKLLAVPAAKRFLSMEPLLGSVNLLLPTRTWANSCGTLACDHCCNGDRCDDPTHFARGRPDYTRHCRCPHCRGTGRGRPIDWVIVGGESGPNSRPMHPDWARSLRDQCQAASVPFLFKQWGEFLPSGADADDPAVPDVPDTRLFWSNGEKWDCFDGQRAGLDLVARVGKKAAGRLLDGVEHNGVPA